MYLSIRCVAAAAVVSMAALASYAQDYEVAVVDRPVPDEIAAPIKEVVAPKAITVKKGDEVVWEFWLRKDIPIGRAGGTLNNIEDLTLLGVARAGKERRDFKDNEIMPGVYTMRMGKIPQDGNHMGVSPHPYFAVLVQAELDQIVEGPESHDAMVDKSMEDTAANHPGVLSLQPYEEGTVEGGLPQYGEGELEWQFVYLTLPCKAEDGDAPLKAGLVFDGFGEI